MNSIIAFSKKYRKQILNIITLTIFVLIAWYLYNNRSVFESLGNLDIITISIVVATMIISVLLNALLNQRIIKILNKDITYKESILLQYSNNFLNKIVTKGGAIFRGYYLKEKHGLSYAKYASTLAGLYIISFLSYSILGLISLLIIYIEYHVFNIIMIVFFFGLLSITLFMLFSKRKLFFKKENRVNKIIKDILDGWDEVRKSPRELLIISLITIITLLTTVIQTIFLYRGLGVEIGIAESMYMSTVNIITVFLNFTPDGIGIKEGVYMFSSQLINLDPDIILLGTLVARAVALIVSIVFGGFSYLFLTKELNGNNFNIKQISKK